MSDYEKQVSQTSNSKGVLGIEAKQVCPDCDDALMNADKKRCEKCQEIWNEGYKIARKEFLDILNKRINYYKNPITSISKAIVYLLEEIKQSLEAKK